MTDTHDCHHDPTSVFPSNTMKLASSASEQNVYFTYVCLVNDIKPVGNLSPSYEPNVKGPLHDLIDVSSTRNNEDICEDPPIQVERSKALHELAESYKKAALDEKAGEQKATDPSQYPTTTSGEESDLSENDETIFLPCDNPNVLKLTKMKWLTEDPDNGPDSSSASISPNTSSSNCSQASESELTETNSFEDKYLSTILRLDKEHNLFGLSNMAIVGAKPSKAKRKDEEKAVFHQTAIVQICCSRKCCRNMSNSDLPASLKCGGCLSRCYDSPCQSCAVTCSPPFCLDNPPCTRTCSTCCWRRCICKFSSCPPYKCRLDCNNYYGLKIKLNRKQKFVEPNVELTPRSSCILQKPMAARTCNHQPHCVPPSSCFPYLMPCYWPARPSAPCTSPARCFHNPPCLPARKPTRVPVPKEYTCSHKCLDIEKNKKCENEICPGNNPRLRKALEIRTDVITKTDVSEQTVLTSQASHTPQVEQTPQANQT